jgi:phosphopantothenoylcysteine decarboxylase/phosphopantothenate--cysteine ligase
MEPVIGALTSGDSGKGRFPDTYEILEEFRSLFLPQDLAGKKVLVSAGGTREAIDPVRFIGNLSSGRQGIEIAEAALERGASVTLVIANSDIPTSPQIHRIDISTVDEMHNALLSEFSNSNIVLMAAAVSDVKPAVISVEKIKKEKLSSIELQKNVDVLASLAAHKSQQVLVAFAAETGSDSVQEAQAKMERKGCDLIYLNDVSGGAIFGSQETSGSIIDSDGIVESFSNESKKNVAHALLNHAFSRLNKLR